MLAPLPALQTQLQEPPGAEGTNAAYFEPRHKKISLSYATSINSDRLRCFLHPNKAVWTQDQADNFPQQVHFWKSFKVFNEIVCECTEKANCHCAGIWNRGLCWKAMHTRCSSTSLYISCNHTFHTPLTSSSLEKVDCVKPSVINGWGFMFVLFKCKWVTVEDVRLGRKSLGCI